MGCRTIGSLEGTTKAIFISLNVYLCKNNYCTVTKEKLRLIRYACSWIVFATEFAVLVIVFSYSTIHFTDHGYNIIVVRYLTEHGNQILLIFGIITTCVLLPIEEYVEEPTQSIVQVNQTNYYGSIN